MPAPTKHVFTPEERNLERERMLKCINFACDFMILISDKFAAGKEMVAIRISDIDPLLIKHSILSIDLRKANFLSTVGGIITDYDTTSCAIWELAHCAHHAFFDVEF